MKRVKDGVALHLTDGSPAIRAGYKAILKSTKYKIVGESSNGVELLNWLKGNKADVVLLDISLNEMNGIEVMQYLHKTNNLQPVIVISDNLQIDYIRNTVGYGALGFVSKVFISRDIFKAIDTVLTGNFFFSIDVQDVLAIEAFQFDKTEVSEFAGYVLSKTLSPQETKIVVNSLMSLTSDELGKRIAIDGSTVRTYKYRVKNKLTEKTKEIFEKRLSLIRGDGN